MYYILLRFKFWWTVPWRWRRREEDCIRLCKMVHWLLLGIQILMDIYSFFEKLLRPWRYCGRFGRRSARFITRCNPPVL